MYHDATNAVLETWEYVGQLIFKNGVPYQLATPDGRAVYNNTTSQWEYEFEYKDHLGNKRVSFKAENGQLVKTAETAFDPWGVRLNGVGSVNGFQNRWEMQGKEREQTFGLNRVNFGARVYNPTIGRFDRSDPLAELDFDLSSYTYVYNNPIIFIDPLGLTPSRVTDCPTCPKSSDFDKYRESSALYTYTDGIVVNGDGSGPTATASRSNYDFQNNGATIVGLRSGSGYNPKSQINDYLQGIDNRKDFIGAFTATGAAIYNAPNLYRESGKFTRKYWSSVKKLGSFYTAGKLLDKAGSLKLKGVPLLNTINAVTEVGLVYNKYQQGSEHVSDYAAAAFNIGLAALTITNPVGLTVLAIYSIADYSGALDPIKQQAKGFIDAKFDDAYQSIKK